MTTNSIPEGCKPFDLERALAGDPVVTRNGQPVTQLVKFDVGGDFDSVYGVLNDSVNFWSAGGQYFTDGESKYDIFMAPKKRTVWVNLCSSRIAYWYISEEEADNWFRTNRIFGTNRIGNRAWPLEIEE